MGHGSSSRLGIESGQNRAFLMAIVAMVFVIAMS
jgi:hypothetical protein